jgi:hypothetical protein
VILASCAAKFPRGLGVVEFLQPQDPAKIYQRITSKIPSSRGGFGLILGLWVMGEFQKLFCFEKQFSHGIVSVL